MIAAQLKVWLTLAVFAALGVLLWHDHHLSKLFKAERANTAALQATLVAERAREAQIQADHKLSQETSHALQQRLSDIERERRAEPLPRLRCVAARVPAAVTEGGGTSGHDGQAAGSEPEAVAFDPSAELEQYGADCAITAERLTALQEWERARSH